MSEQIARVGDIFSLSVLVGYFVSALPAVATFVTIIWTILRIYEMETVQRWLKKRKDNEPIS